MIIPYNAISEAALQALIEDFVTRDGTDYGEDEKSTRQKAEHLLALLKAGDLLITYNEVTEDCGLISKDQLSNNI
jgi:uncharacterized protein YheU (UPF0270 family)